MFGIAWAFVAHTDSRFDPEMLCRFVRAYQRVQPLTIGELWAVAITLRIVLVENLRRAAKRIVSEPGSAPGSGCLGRPAPGRERRMRPSRSPWSFTRYEQAPLPEAFAVQLVQRLRDQDPEVTPALTWLEERLAAQGTTADEIVRDEHQRQGATNVTTRNIITSMRLISDVDWTELVESVSLVDDVLQSGSDFASMDFPTRNLYRSAIEELARGSKLTELEIARAALVAAAAPKHQACQGGRWRSTSRKRDPGYHLIAGGRRAFEGTSDFARPCGLAWSFRTKIGIGGYIGSVIIVAAIVLLLPLIALAEPRTRRLVAGSSWRSSD